MYVLLKYIDLFNTIYCVSQNFDEGKSLINLTNLVQIVKLKLSYSYKCL